MSDSTLRFTREWTRLEQRGVLTRLADAELRESALCLEREAFESADLGIFLSVIATYGLGAPILREVGRELPKGAVLSVAITEPNAGSDPRALQSRLHEEGTQLRLRGQKWCITNAPVATHAIVFCRHTATQRACAVLLDCNQAGVRASAPLHTIGALSSPTGSFDFDVVVPRTDLLGVIGDGERLMALAFVRERLLAPWPLLGMAARVLQLALRHARVREQFGAPIAQQQHMQARLVRAYEHYLSARALALDTLSTYEGAQPIELRASLVKARAAAMAEHVVREAIAVLASRGVQQAARLGEYLQDAVCASIAGGTEEIHRRVVFDALCMNSLRVQRGQRSVSFPYSIVET